MVAGGTIFGHVHENRLMDHKIMVPPNVSGTCVSAMGWHLVNQPTPYCTCSDALIILSTVRPREVDRQEGRVHREGQRDDP